MKSLAAQWFSSASELPARAGAVLEPVYHTLSQPAHMRRIRRLVMALFALWGALALARLVWALVPGAESAPAPLPDVINPVDSGTSMVEARELDIERMRDWHLFGEPGAAAEEPVPQQTASVRDGIEKDAQETRLDLKLRGIVASTEDGLGHAIIEYRARQEVYAVEDKLPVPGRVRLAKVMPRQVILDNGGTYERLELYEESDLAAARGPLQPPASAADERRIDKRNEREVTALATSYRSRLYENPQSLAEVVNVSAVRRDGSLLGYRVVPGRDQAQFEALGFQPGDLVTSVNGISLDSPANTMRLYNAMRSAGEVVFELQRGDRQLSLAVGLE
ncbi:MAG: type II secretion system protein GspC [Halioglobus sp.]|nr:type II secretion system protein GspC [Halioglobus sp.]